MAARLTRCPSRLALLAAALFVGATSAGAPAESLHLVVDEAAAAGHLDLTSYSLGQGGLSCQPMFRPHVSQLKELHPKTIRIFIQEYYKLYPDHGVYDWSKLDQTFADVVATGATPIANVCFKPKVLFPTINQAIVDASKKE